tara:strand:+ start:101 stop:376 length:276 start_codon:yes stop_codon:yes gene_type:complete
MITNINNYNNLNKEVKMAILSVSVPGNLKEKMTKLDEVNWSAVARNAFEEKVKQVEFMKGLARKSMLTAGDAKKISDKINKAMAKKFMEMK